MRPGHARATLVAMPLWAITVTVLGAILVVGSVLVGLAAAKLNRSQPD